MKHETKQTVKQVVLMAIVSAIILALFSKYKDNLPLCVKKFIKE